ncbi:hypothetical protein A3E39_04365 [Candidatus Uhrbacteria bacterium RIFCSPHIGHO2_12_FULL_60_25]|uniref:Uncharacterized protein n=1 Tax=Candidatus Uhrbacteria bacterium RIFCSPHIGHO2_12_FULL_60_25 TaxID=1802399 RepID=A0A1F7UIL5_9BACT|nr:MAG: hypothetical protein A3D73_00915 [Candidatus Uhrbacteria bacterium RIFCSPHIGHO2_02_FULL_60_44]OGL78121.1 MAG: hypothetical protein A3E39_04365 [Candidatus Uhrbacteria bacterium RIFCSPHIGHO2_12_FULL_60_25]
MLAVACYYRAPPTQKPVVPAVDIPTIPTGGAYAEAYRSPPTPHGAVRDIQCTYHIIGDTREFPSSLQAILAAGQLGFTEKEVEVSCYHQATFDPPVVPSFSP